jgi:sugar lactone lactonase YvrE
MQTEKDGVRYFNSGCWTGDEPTYITVDHARVRIHRYSLAPCPIKELEFLIAPEPVGQL